MVMRKFKKSIDEPAGENPEIGLNSPRLTRRNRGGSFSGKATSGSPLLFSRGLSKYVIYNTYSKRDLHI